MLTNFLIHFRMTEKPTGKRLATYLSRWIWFCLVPLILLVVYLAIERIRDIQSDTNRAATRITKNLATSIDNYLNTRIGVLNMLAGSPLLNDPSRLLDFYQEAQGYQRSFDSHVILADLEHHMLFIRPYPKPLIHQPRINRLERF